MKLSLSWIFDHINSDWRYHDVATLVQQLNLSTAEIEHYEKITFNPDLFTLVTYQESRTDKHAFVFSPELNKEFFMPQRTDLVVGNHYLLALEQGNYRWATLADFHNTKDGLLPAFNVPKNQLQGDWKETIETEDYILHLENKSITHRPDLWGHRGFAREIAALLNLSLHPEDHFLVLKPIKHYETKSPRLPTQKISLEIKTPACKRLAALYIDNTNCPPSSITMAQRLCRIDARPLNFIVDATNYVMFDSGQPMHAFDATAFPSQTLIANTARAGDKLTLLDNETITLSAHDIIISDGEKPVSLAGITGGKESSIWPTTKAIIIEAANFDAATIRKTAARIKKRTEASARFEKSLDPHQNTQALLRFLKLMDDAELPYTAAEAIISLGPLVSEQTITISHDFITKRLGISLTPEVIMHNLASIGFGIQVDKSLTYHVTVPTYRGSKDTVLKEDIVEEVGRLVGYTNFPQQLPQRAMKPFSIIPLQRMRLLKHHAAYAMALHEVYNYALYDEEFLQRLKWQPEGAASLINPLSSHWQRLVTSLIPHLIKNVYQNQAVHEEALQFFEVARTWHLATDKVVEEKKVAGILFHKKSYDFYAGKAALISLFNALSVFVSWQKQIKPIGPWFNAHQTAQLVDENLKVIGYAGMLDTTFAPILEGKAFIFELDAAYLTEQLPQQSAYEPLPKYPPVYLDISMLAPLSVSVADLENTIVQTDMRIRDIQLIDFYQKEEWHDKHSITLRLVIIDDEKTLTKEEIDTVWNDIVSSVQQKGATVR